MPHFDKDQPIWSLTGIIAVWCAVLGGWTGWCGKELYVWGNASLFVVLSALVWGAGAVLLGLVLAIWDRKFQAGALLGLLGIVLLVIVAGAVFGAVFLLPAVYASLVTNDLADPTTRLICGGILGGLVGFGAGWYSDYSRRKFIRGKRGEQAKQ